jgi:FkbM family methyltransferase
MLRTDLTRWMAGALGIIGRGTGLSRNSSLQALYFQLSGPLVPDRDLWVKMDGQDMFIPSPRRNVLGRRIYLHGIWEEVVTRVLIEEIHQGMTVLDIGAHVGYYTLLMAKRVGKAGKVFAFEPQSEVRNYLEQNVQRNGYSQVAILPLALFSKEGVGLLEGRDNLNACLSPRSSPSTGSIKMVVFDQFKKKIKIEKIDLVKMDVEGAEMDILLGMRDSLKKNHPELIIEVHQNGLVRFGHSEMELRQYISSFGYHIRDIWSQTGTITILCKSAKT